MILIADSGSTKTDWRCVQPDNTIKQFISGGLNPFFMDTDAIYLHLQKRLADKIDTQSVSEVHFYGAGCSSDKRCQTVAQALGQFFEHAKIFVAHDMLAAARALCGQEAGIACILGTGSNACSFDGNEIQKDSINLGIWLGDEGSGGYLGKTLVQAFMYDEMPKNLRELFQSQYQLSREDLLEAVYQKPQPNAYLATYSRFLYKNLNEAFCYRLVYDAFVLFLRRHVLPLQNLEKNLPVNFTGSVAFHFSNVLRKACQKEGLMLRHIVEKPIAGLTLYHQSAFDS
ncbi:MAG: N-acetylglucosamine kinase [Bernardetiaceae bacterium]|nr:N-acetylglucosamine kinase [Bernardetiaceae bacterium]